MIELSYKSWYTVLEVGGVSQKILDRRPDH